MKLFTTTGLISSASPLVRSSQRQRLSSIQFTGFRYTYLAVAVALATLVVAISLVPVANAETLGPPTTWDYTFSTDFTTCTATALTCFSTSGDVVFTLESVTLSGLEPNSPCVKGGWEEVVGMTGSINGAAISFAPADVSSCGVDELFLPSEQQGLMRPSIASIIPFTAGGLNWSIFAPDIHPYNNSVLINNSAGQIAVINWDLTDPPVATPEPSSFAMVLIGLVGILFFMRSR